LLTCSSVQVRPEPGELEAVTLEGVLMTVGNIPVENRDREPVAPAWQRVRWGAVFAGLVITVVTQMLLTLLGLAIGFTAVDPREGAPGRGLGIGAAIWGVLSLLVSLYVGSFLAGRLSGVLRRGDGALNGVLVWAVSLLAMVYFVSTGVSSLLSGLFGMVGGVAQTAATVAGQGAASATATGRDPAEQVRQAARDAGINVDRVQQQAQQTAQQAQETAQRVGQSGTAENQQAKEAAAKATGYAATGAWSTLLAALLGLGVAAWGGASGARADWERTAAGA
jgi:pyruvate/2-oxoglutarate dehydrogenase complex dihydrolipoamide acyltransferase (E2) component